MDMLHQNVDTKLQFNKHPQKDKDVLQNEIILSR